MTAIGRLPARSRAAAPQDAEGLRSLARDPLRVSLFLLTVVTVSRVHEALGLGALHPAFLLFAFAAGYAMITPRTLARGDIFRFWPVRVLLGLAVLACLSAAFGISLGAAAMFILTDYSKTLAYAFLLILAIRGVRDLSLFIWAYVISCGILVWLAVFVFQLHVTASGIARLGNLYTYDANDLGCVLMVGLPLTVLTFQTSRLRGKIVSALILFGMGWAIARSGSRGALVGLVAVGFVILATLKQVSIAKRAAFVGAVAIALLLAAPKGYWEQMGTILQPTEDYNWTAKDGRKEIAERGLEYMWKHPVFGIGINNFGRAEGTLSEIAEHFQPGDAGVRWAAPHNSFIQAGAELGIPGLILWSSLVFGGIFGTIRLRRRMPRAWAHGNPEQRFIYLTGVYLPIAFVGFAATASLVSFAYLDPIYILAAYVVALQRCVNEQFRRAGPVPAGQRRGRETRKPVQRRGMPHPGMSHPGAPHP